MSISAHVSKYPVTLDAKLDPFKHQVEAFSLSQKARTFAYFMEMGTGKTKIVIDQAAYYYLQGWIQCLVVIAPKGVYRNWTEIEIPKHMPIESWDAYWTGIHDAEARDMYRAFFLSDVKTFRTFVINVESLSGDAKKCRGLEMLIRVLTTFKCYVAVDESTTIKNLSASRTKNLINISDQKMMPIKRIMSGNPVTRSPMDLYAQCWFLNPNHLGHRSFYSFRARYAVMKDQHLAGQKSFKSIVGYQKLDELQQILKGFSYRVTKEECLDLPEKVYMVRDVELTPEQKKLYVKIRDEAFAEFAGKIITAPMVITRLLRLHQIVCGHFKDDNGEVVDVPTNRIDQLLEVLDEAPGKVVIWATYRRDIEKIQASLQKEHGPASTVVFHGDTSEADRILAVNSFQNNRDVRYFLGNPAAGRFGITLTAASTMVYFSNSYDLEHRIQSEDRIHRIGQTRSCTYIDLLTRGSVDERIIRALRSKKRIAADSLGDQWRDWLG